MLRMSMSIQASTLSELCGKVNQVKPKAQGDTGWSIRCWTLLGWLGMAIGYRTYLRISRFALAGDRWKFVCVGRDH